MWPYYLSDTAVREKLTQTGELLALSYGKVYRNDEIDRSHYPVFHQIDGIGICRRSSHAYTVEDLVEILLAIARAVYGDTVQWRVEEDRFPFTDPSIDLQIEQEGTWLEVLGAGLVSTKVLELLGIDPGVYNGWAFGFGLDRLAMLKMRIADIRILWSDDPRITKQFKSIDSVYQEVSKYPPVDRDISMIIDKSVSVNLIYELMRDCGYRADEDLIEEVKLIDTWSNDEKFGRDRISYTFRIRYRSHVRSLTNDEINEVQERLRLRVIDEFGVLMR
jgi:phenylalanyl-tRNA synthetase alpha chain